MKTSNQVLVPISKEDNNFGTLVLYKKGASIYLPHFVPYHFILQPKRFEVHKEVAIYSVFFQELKNNNTDIFLRLPPQFTDARSLTWQGYQVTQRYTAIIDTSENFSFSEKEQTEINKIKKRGIFILESKLDSETLDYHLNFLKKNNVYSKSVKQISAELLANATSVNVLNVIEDKRILISLIWFADPLGKVAFLKYQAVDENFRMQGGTRWFCDELLPFFREKGFTQIDFCGANIESIAQFKSRIGTTLVPYFEAYFHRSWKAKLKQFYKTYLMQ